jgi:PAS domain S-box-containing protein
MAAPTYPDPAATLLPSREAQELFEHVPDAILVVDDEGRILRANSQASRMFGYEADELADAFIEALLPERLRERHVGHRSAYYAEPRMRPMGASLELYGRRKDGSEFPLDIMLSPMDSGAERMVLAVVRDISERKRAETAIRESQAMFQGLFEHSPDAVVVVDAEGHIRRVNAQFERLFGYPRDQILGQPMEQLLPERLRSQHVGHRSAYLYEPRTRPMGANLELYGRRSDGTEFPVDIMLSPMQLGGTSLVLGVIRDVTERKLAEQQREVLLREIHHRVKNNLQVVSSMLNLQSESLTDEQLLGVITESQNRIGSIALIHEKLYRSKDLSRVNASEYIADLCTNLFHSYGRGASRVDLTLSVTDVTLSLDTAVPCGLIINELVSNSLKHAFPEDRSGEIGVELSHGKEGFMLAVGDTGVGFPQDLDFRETESLGLQLVNILVQQLDGSIELDSDRQGTRFEIRFREPAYKERA